ncbi:MAG: hypothetical protein PHG83_03785 [Patescibacteria group bacterium]|nr:hypothetical protein [Patescibacteria group bacterium]
MKKINIIILMVCVILFFVVASVYLNLFKKNNPASNQMENKIISENKINENVVGGDRDEHGCIGSAGYSWCEAKQKCLRIWEEACYENNEQEIQYLLAKKYNKSISEVLVKATKENENYMVGNVHFTQKDLPAGGEGGMFMAAKVENVWKLVYDGNGSIDCNFIKANYQFTEEMLKGFCD